MSTKRNSAAPVKIGFFAVFFLLIFFTVCLLVMLVHPAKDIRDVPTDSRTPSTSDSSSEPPSGAQPTGTDPSMPASSDSSSNGKYTYTFTADLSAYEKYMEPGTDDYLFLVNATHTLDADYAPSDLVSVVNIRTDGRSAQMREYAEKALEALFIEAEAQGMTYVNSATGQKLSVMSAYRDYAYQGQLFNTYTNREMAKNPSLTREQAEAITVTYSNRPGTSEHQTGLCCDMHNLSSADQSFKTERAAKWLADNCYKFGFILRYPEDKTDITGTLYEPWHFRYVGRYHASEMNRLGMCLEEYMKYLGRD